MTPTPEITIIIPVYNIEEYIIECLDSVVFQDIEVPLEIIVVDDCGTDRSMSLVENYQKCHSNAERNIRIIRHERNRGQSVGRNNGIKASEGNYLFFMDSDDAFFSKDSLRLLYRRIKETNADIVFGEHCFSRNDKIENTTDFYRKSGGSIKGQNEILTSYLSKWEMIPWNKLINRNFIVLNNIFFPKDIYYEDNYWAFTVALKAKHIEVIPEITYNYRQRSDSTIHTFTERHYKSIIEVVRLHYNKIVEEHLLKKENKDIIVCFYERCRQNMFRAAFLNLGGKGPEVKELFYILKQYSIVPPDAILCNKSMRIRWKKRSIAFYAGNAGYHYLCHKYKKALRKSRRE